MRTRYTATARLPCLRGLYQDEKPPRDAAVFSAADFLGTLRTSGVLPPQTVAALARDEPRDPRAWASELVECGLLTGYQAEQVLAGNGHSFGWDSIASSTLWAAAAWVAFTRPNTS